MEEKFPSLLPVPAVPFSSTQVAAFAPRSRSVLAVQAILDQLPHSEVELSSPLDDLPAAELDLCELLILGLTDHIPNVQ
jgi:hypothetical protein